LYGAIGTSASPLVFDVRRGAAFDADDRMLVPGRCSASIPLSRGARHAVMRAVMPMMKALRDG